MYVLTDPAAPLLDSSSQISCKSELVQVFDRKKRNLTGLLLVTPTNHFGLLPHLPLHLRCLLHPLLHLHPRHTLRILGHKSILGYRQAGFVLPIGQEKDSWEHLCISFLNHVVKDDY